MRINLTVHGRFHAFDLAQVLTRRGHDVRVFTNYPASVAQEFGLTRAQVSSFVVHGILSRAAWKLRAYAPWLYPEAQLHHMFGNWAMRALQRETWDIVHPWSGVSEELLRQRAPKANYLLMRGSAHIRTQAELLAQEQTRTRAPQEQPSAWMIAREEREYALADHIITLSTFARNSFLERGFDPARVWNLPLAAPAQQFRPAPETVNARCARLLAGAPLRVLYVGALSFQKGMWDFATMARVLDAQKFILRCVGPQTPETETLVNAMRSRVEIIPKVPQAELPAHYAWGDVFVYPTIQDGYAQVLAQAQASALPVLSTVNSGAPDMLIENETGWLLPIRSPDAFVERLHWCDTHRAELAAMVTRLADEFQLRTYADVAREFEMICERVREIAP